MKIILNIFLEKSKLHKQVSLKDLCPEDKKRIAHLIQELADLQEEKEGVDERYEQERKDFKDKV